MIALVKVPTRLGTLDMMPDTTPSSWVRLRLLVWYPDQVRKKSLSVPVAFKVSMACRPAMEAPAIFDFWLRRLLLSSLRLRLTRRTAITLVAVSATAAPVSGALYISITLP